MTNKPRYRYEWKNARAIPAPSSPPPARSVTGYDPSREVLPKADDFCGWLLLGVLIGGVVGSVVTILLI